MECAEACLQRKAQLWGKALKCWPRQSQLKQPKRQKGAGAYFKPERACMIYSHLLKKKTFWVQAHNSQLLSVMCTLRYTEKWIHATFILSLCVSQENCLHPQGVPLKARREAGQGSGCTTVARQQVWAAVWFCVTKRCGKYPPRDDM